MASVDFYSDLSMAVYAGLVTSSIAGAVLKADTVSECGAYSTDAYFIMEQLCWLECTISSSYLEKCRLSDLHHSSDLTSHGVGLANHILVDSYFEF